MKIGYLLSNPELDKVINQLMYRCGEKSYKFHLVFDLLNLWQQSNIDCLQTFIQGEIQRHLMVVLRLKYKENICNHLGDIEYKTLYECQKVIEYFTLYFGKIK
tara:strand:- start:1310 stop:1618 length:309 start_codon:yes stop_codon:yes gene_type:complete